jgi:hypothetical protein
MVFEVDESKPDVLKCRIGPDRLLYLSAKERFSLSAHAVEGQDLTRAIEGKVQERLDDDVQLSVAVDESSQRIRPLHAGRIDWLGRIGHGSLAKLMSPPRSYSDMSVPSKSQCKPERRASPDLIAGGPQLVGIARAVA